MVKGEQTMFTKIKDEDIINIDEIKRIVKDIEIVYEETEDYKNFKKSSNSAIGIFFGTRYTDNIIKEIYKLIIYTDSFDTIEYVYNTIDDRNKDFDTIWNQMNVYVMISNGASIKDGE